MAKPRRLRERRPARKPFTKLDMRRFIKQRLKDEPTYFTIRVNGHLYGVWDGHTGFKMGWHAQLLECRSKTFPFITRKRINEACGLLDNLPEEGFAGLTPKQFMQKVLNGKS